MYGKMLIRIKGKYFIKNIRFNLDVKWEAEEAEV